MGVAFLAKQLHAFAEFSPLGCKSEGCKEHPSEKKIVIDGPSLAYHIYNRGLAHSPSSLSAIDAIPSYDRLGKAALAFLDELECHGATIEHIFFDGAISKDREEIRKSRLEACVKQLNSAHQTYFNGFKVSNEVTTMAPVNTAEVFDSTRPVLPSRKALPPPAFLVPAVLDALRTSKYAPISSVVPGEADLFCARAALESRHTIFTNDSDLLLYDLATSSEVAFFNRLELKSSHDTSRNCSLLYARLSQPAKIVSRLGLRGLRRLAFEIREDKSIKLRHAIECAKQSMAFLGSRSSSTRQNAFEKFEEEYDIEVSDFEAFIRSSAWEVSRELRYFAYSCLGFKESERPLEQVSEYVRRGARIVRDDVSLLSREEAIRYATAFTVKLEKFRSFLADFSKSSIWRPYALYEVFDWYVGSGKEPPSKHTLTTVFSGTNKDERLSWYEVHISAQLQAVLYSLRMLLQILRHLSFAIQQKIEISQKIHEEPLASRTVESLVLPREPSNLPVEFLRLEHLLSTLPFLDELIPSRLELEANHTMPAVEVEYLLTALFTSNQINHAPSKRCYEDYNAPSPKSLDGLRCKEKDGRKKIHAISTRRSGKIDSTKGVDESNRFNVLEAE
ncbi:hypothetical protein MMC07_008173 [Pseudocyphellaria aurata]|nr:hypothetical protein [Pseudocyphellaria aurata]